LLLHNKEGGGDVDEFGACGVLAEQMGNCFSSYQANLNKKPTCSNVWEVYDGMYISGLEGACETACLKQLGVSHVLNLLGWGAYRPELGGRSEAYAPDDFVYKVIYSHDMPEENLSRFFAETSKFIDEGRKAGGVLVHCFAGIPRSSTCICAYLMEYQAMTLVNALKQVRTGRPIANPNTGFMIQLLDLEADLRKRNILPDKAEDDNSFYLTGPGSYKMAPATSFPSFPPQGPSSMGYAFPPQAASFPPPNLLTGAPCA